MSNQKMAGQSGAVPWIRRRKSADDGVESFSFMKGPTFTAVIEREEDWFIATCPELGVSSQGRTIAEAESMIKEAVDLLLEEADEAEIARRLSRGVKVL